MMEPWPGHYADDNLAAEIQRLMDDEECTEQEASAAVHTCALCHSEDTDTTLFKPSVFPRQLTPEEHPNGIAMCPYCYETHAGNTLMAAGYTPDTYVIVQSLAGMFNLLEKRLKQ